jgi:dolichol-phosphate mannosyltransferase
MTPRAVSVVVPVHDEAGAIGALVTEIATALAGLEFEIIIVDDGSTDATPAILTGLAMAEPALRVLTHPHRAGQSSAIRTGVRAARHEWIATLDGDGQNPPDQIPRLLDALRSGRTERVGLVQGQRAERRDSISRQLGSAIANAIRAAALGDGVRDSGCGLRLFRRDAFLDLPFFDHIHRFLPAMMRREGWEIRLVAVEHRPRTSGRSKYSNLQRALVGLVDLAGAAWLIRRASPLAGPPPRAATEKGPETRPLAAGR